MSDITLRKHIFKRIGIFISILLVITLLFYIHSLISIDGFAFFSFFVAMFFLVFFSIAFLLFEASELKFKKEFANQKFNQFIAISLILFLTITLIWFLLGATNNF